ncbi:11708_t:CDS:2, partial [Dentiscutata heterogama]
LVTVTLTCNPTSFFSPITVGVSPSLETLEFANKKLTFKIKVFDAQDEESSVSCLALIRPAANPFILSGVSLLFK